MQAINSNFCVKINYLIRALLIYGINELLRFDYGNVTSELILV